MKVLSPGRVSILIWVKAPPVHSRLAPEADTSEQPRPDFAIAAFGADIDLEAIDLLGGGAAADPALVVDDDRMQPGMGQPCRGAKSACAGPDHDSG